MHSGSSSCSITGSTLSWTGNSWKTSARGTRFVQSLGGETLGPVPLGDNVELDELAADLVSQPIVERRFDGPFDDGVPVLLDAGQVSVDLFGIHADQPKEHRSKPKIEGEEDGYDRPSSETRSISSIGFLNSPIHFPPRSTLCLIWR